MIAHTHYFLLLIQTAILEDRLERTREKFRRHPEPVALIESMQHERALKQNEDLASFSEALMELVHKIEGLENLRFAQLSDITEDEFGNRENRMQRVNKLGELKQVLHSFMDGDECSGVLCENKRSQMSHRASGGWDKDHQADKTGDPNKLATKSNGEFVNELVEEDKGFFDICAFCHDRGTKRREALEKFKRVRKSNLYYVTTYHSTNTNLRYSHFSFLYQYQVSSIQMMKLVGISTARHWKYYVIQ